MAKFTMTIGEMVTAFRKQLQVTKTEALTLPDGTSWTFERLNQLPTLQTTITDYSYPWLIHEIETLKEYYSDDSQLNRSISNQLAQTFVRHFWQYEIGFETPDVFAIQLRAFFDSYMPIFIKWYQQYAVQNQAYLTSVTNLTRNVDGTIHMTGSGKADGSLKDTTTTDGTTNQNGTAKTTGKTSETQTGSQTGTTKTTGKTTDTETGNQTGTTKTTSAQNSQDKSLSGTADTPQDQLNTDFGASDPVAGYNFDYASQVVGSNTTNKTTGDETQTSSTDTTASKTGTSDTTQTTSTDTQANRSGTSETDTTTTDAGASHSETDRTQTTSNATENTNDQKSNNKEGAQTQDRTQTIMDLTNQLLNYVDGLYLDMFSRMLEYGLFMQVF